MSPRHPVSTAAADFQIYEEHSVYRREFLGRAATANEADMQAKDHSRRSGLVISVRQRQAGASAMVASFRAGKRVNPQTAAHLPGESAT